MNVYEMDGAVLDMVYEDVSDSNRSLYSAGFLQSYNQAYGELQRTIFHPTIWEEVTLSGRTFLITSLTLTCAGIEKISKYKDYSEDANYLPSPAYAFKVVPPSTVVVPASSETSMWVMYECRYASLLNATPTVKPSEATTTNTPQIPADAHHLLCLRAAADFYTRRRRSDLATEMMSEFYRIKGTLRPMSTNTDVGKMKNMFSDYRGWQ